ncbi:MAG: hypothetical protein IKC26_01810 [Clostridia bacterium]|nr:hypothetical protein [Clostridia bacterium]
MIEWWNELIVAQQIFLLVAIPSTVILVIQTILLLIGLNDDVDVDVDIDDLGDDGLTLFSVRGIVSMLCIAGWSGFALCGTSLPLVVSILIAVLLGILTLIGMAFLMRSLQRLQSSGNIQISNTIGKVGQVYILIPANAAAAGKINITVQEKYSEFLAITMEAETITTGTYVRVVAVNDAGVLVVERVSANS